MGSRLDVGLRTKELSLQQFRTRNGYWSEKEVKFRRYTETVKEGPLLTGYTGLYNLGHRRFRQIQL